MASFKELLKEVENANRTGFKDGAWFPHKSAEGGTRTLGYGHKLTQQEEDGNYVVLPNGTIVDFSNRGLTDQEIEMLFDADIQKHKSIAATQWNNSQKTPFASLSPLHQSVLTEIAFNIGTLKNSKGKWGWPSLAKGILNNDTEVIKQEIMRSFTDSKGNKKPLTNRVNKIRRFIDQANADPQSVALEGFEPTGDVKEPEMSYSKLLQGMMSALDELQQPQQRQPQAATDPSTQSNREKEIDQLLKETLGGGDREVIARGERRLEQTYNEVLAEEENENFSKKEEKNIQRAMELMGSTERVVLRETTNPPPEEQPEESQERVRDDSKDPIYGIF